MHSAPFVTSTPLLCLCPSAFLCPFLCSFLCPYHLSGLCMSCLGVPRDTLSTREQRYSFLVAISRLVVATYQRPFSVFREAICTRFRVGAYTITPLPLHASIILADLLIHPCRYCVALIPREVRGGLLEFFHPKFKVGR